MSKFVSVDEVVSIALSIMPAADDRVKMFAREWAYIAQKEIGAMEGSVKESDFLPVIDFAVEKPSDLYMNMAIALFDDSFGSLRYTYNGEGTRRIHPETRGSRNTIDVSDDAYRYYISTNATNCKWMKLRYFAFPIDENGLPLIPENNVNATVHFIRYMFAQRNSEPIGAISEHFARWRQMKAQAIGRNNTISELEGEAIAQRFPSMIQKAIDKVKYGF